MTKHISNHFSKANYTIVSGMAKGIDTIAHQTSIDNNKKTIAVLAHGLSNIYPQSNYHFYEYAKDSNQKNLLLISEYDITAKPMRYHFPRRNRIISGLSEKTFFIEGSIKSGGLITVKYALDQGRDVYALSHELLTNNAGGDKLISEGAGNLIDIFSIKTKNPNEKKEFSTMLEDEHYFYLGSGTWAMIQDNINFNEMKKQLSLEFS